MAEKGAQMLGRYQLLALLATGGMAEIYLARQTGIGGFEKLVVVKRILSHLAREKAFVEMFFDEAVIAAQLNHPNVVQIYDLGQAGEHYFIAMEFLEGESLGYLVNEAAKTGESLSPALAAGIVAQVCDGLDYAHKFKDESGRALHIVHRDISPHNVIVLFSGVAKLVDFGIAKASTKVHQTRVGTLKGKLSYMSPEQCLGQPVDGRSDQFSLGVVLWELLTHRRLFKRDAEAVIIRAVVDEPVPRADEVRPEVPKALADIAARALAKDPAARYSTVGELGAALREVLRESGQEAGPPEIAAFCARVFKDRARTKQRLLEEIRAKGADGVSLGVLKPASGSIPSRSFQPGEAEPVAASETLIKPQADEPPKRKARTGSQVREPDPSSGKLAWVVVGVLLVVIGAGGGFLLLSGPSEEPRNPKVEPIEPEKPPVVEPEKPPVVEPEKPPVVEPEKPPVVEPEKPPVAEPEKPPVAEPVKPPEKKPPVAKPPEKKPPVVKPPTVAKAQPGTLKLNTKPWTEIYRGEQKLGITPLVDVKLPAGKHKLRAVNKAKGIDKLIDVTIKPGEATTLKLVLE